MTEREDERLDRLEAIVGESGDPSFVAVAGRRNLTDEEREAIGGEGIAGEVTHLRVELAELKRWRLMGSLAAGVATGVVSNPHLVVDLLRLLGMGV